MNFETLSIFRGRSPLRLLMDWAVGGDCVLCAGASARGPVCAECAADLPGVRDRAPGVSVAFAYRFPVDRLVLRMKGGDLAVGSWLADRLVEAVRHEPRPALLVPVPMRARRLRERGFNPAAEIARRVGSRLRVACAARGARKVRDTRPQQGLDRRARRLNVRRAFECRVDVRGRDVAIVDDVVTTGATAKALASALRRAGARRIRVWAVARAPGGRAR